jgi:hypothetical protein
MKIKGVARSDRRRDRQKAAHASGCSGLGARPQRRGGCFAASRVEEDAGTRTEKGTRRPRAGANTPGGPVHHPNGRDRMDKRHQAVSTLRGE